jgi:hypothetical protein
MASVTRIFVSGGNHELRCGEETSAPSTSPSPTGMPASPAASWHCRPRNKRYIILVEECRPHGRYASAIGYAARRA